MAPYAVFGITDDGLSLAVNLLLLSLVVFWIALIYWTYADASRRMSDPMLVGCATAASLFPFVGTLVYVIVRPPEYLVDVRERELEIAAAEARLASVERLTCPQCANDIERAFLSCPNCQRRLKEPCATCGKPLDPRWSLCPYCEADVARGRAATPPARARAPASRQAAAQGSPRAEARPARRASGAPQRAGAAPAGAAPQRQSREAGAAPQRQSMEGGSAPQRQPREADSAPQRQSREAGSTRRPREGDGSPARKVAPRTSRPTAATDGRARSEERPAQPRPGDAQRVPDDEPPRVRPAGQRVRPKS